jgi:hypothetical protein
VAGLVLLAAALLSGCSANPSGVRYVDAAGAKAEYVDETKKLNLAPGWTWPTDPGYESSNPDGSTNLYEVNAGRVDAAWYWHCSWARTLLAATDANERARAFVEVLRLKESAFYEWGLQERDRRARDEVLEKAQAGDTEPLSQIVMLNCPVATR